MSALPLLGVNGDIAPRVAIHALNRLGYGPRPGDVDAILKLGIGKWVQEQLEPAADPELDARLSSLASLRYSTTQVLALYNADNRSIGPIIDEFYSAKIIRGAHARNQLQEVLVDFWFNHFNVYILDGFDRYSTMSYERDAIRPHVLGNFRDLLGATAEHPAMLYYLDNYLSTVSRVVGGRIVQGLNENYGRELLELHSVGVDAGYTQEDVFEASRCFTGWGIDNLGNSGRFMYRPANHDRDAKRVFGLAVPAGGAKDDGDKLIDYLALHPATALFVSTKLARRFIGDDPPARVVQKMADTFLSTGGDIKSVMETLIGSAEFWAPAFDEAGLKPRAPIEFAISAIRAVGGEVQSGTRGVTPYLANMGMPVYQCLPPTGYSARGSDWVNPSSHLYRMNFALDLAAGRIAGVGVNGLRALTAGVDQSDPRALANAINEEVFAGTLTRASLEAAYRVDPRSTVSVSSRVTSLLLAGPEFQVR